MTTQLQPSGVITITTDFGHKGPFVGTMKGVILSRYPQAKIIDLTHETLVHWPAEAGFWLSRAFRYFPLGTVHVAVVDPGVGTRRDIIAASQQGHVFLAPDNGLLAPVLKRQESTRIHRLDLARIKPLLLDDPSATFHGRDIFAPVAAALASGACRISDLGPTFPDIVPSWIDDPTVTEAGVFGTVITIDTFGNLVTNIDRSLVEPLSDPVVRIAGRRLKLHRTYGDVSPGEQLALINSFGVLEIATAEGNAAETLGVERGAPVAVVAAGGTER